MLEVAHERCVRRIAEEVVERPRGSLFLAVGRSGAVRAAVEAALGKRDPGLVVVSTMLGDDTAPWRRVVEARDTSETAEGKKVLLSVAGLGDMAEDRFDRVAEHLNLGRELRVIDRLHVLLWVGRLDRLDRFRTMAPDLWGHRSGVELFLSSKDFDVPLPDVEPGEEPKDMKALLRETEAELALRLRPTRRAVLLASKAAWLQELGRRDEALNTVEEAEELLARSVGAEQYEQALAHAEVATRRLILLRAANRSEEALSYAMNVDQNPFSDPYLHWFVKGELGRLHMLAGRVRQSLASFADALSLYPTLPRGHPGAQSASIAACAQLLETCGALDAAVRDALAASTEVESVRRRSEGDKIAHQMILLSMDDTLARVSFARGDIMSALTHAHRSIARVIALSVMGRILSTLGVVSEIYSSCGLFGDARRFARRAIAFLEHSPGEVAWWMRRLGARDSDEGQLDAAINRYESAVSLYRTAARAEHGPHRRASWLRDAASVLYEDLASLSGPSMSTRHFEAAAELLTLASHAATEAASPEQHALTQQSRASLAAARKQWDLAESELLAFLTWAEANWGPCKRAEVLLDLARIARERGDLPHAATYAERAQREVAIDPPEYFNRFTGIAAARELARIRKAQGDITAAHAALTAALTIAAGDKLRLREREVRLDLAELPPLPGQRDDRLDHAQRARSIAQDAAFPVDEAEAMLVVAELHLEAGGARRAQALFDQAAWIVDRIGPRAVRERAARVRAKLGDPG